MKKAIAIALVMGFTGYAAAQMANCWQQYVCGPAGCQWVTICR
jgi:hypothetical protein